MKFLVRPKAVENFSAVCGRQIGKCGVQVGKTVAACGRQIGKIHLYCGVQVGRY